MTSHDTGLLLHEMTLPPEVAPNRELKEALNNIMRGQRENDCLSRFQSLRVKLAMDYLNLLSKVLGDPRFAALPPAALLWL
jgi:hypothetical protein